MKVTPIVERTLEKYEKARSSDKLLLLYIWHQLGLEFTPEQREKFMDMPSAETIRRIRQKLQENGKYPANGHVRKDRHIRSMVVQQNAPAAKPERIETILQQKLI